MDEIERLIQVEVKLAHPGSPNDYSSHKNMDWIRAALVALLKAEQERRLEGSG